MKILIYGVLAGVVAMAGLRFLSRKLLYYPVPMEPGQETVLKKLKGTIAPLAVTAGDGTVLRGWCIEKDVKALPFIFYFGGNAEEVSLNLEEFLAQVPANVVLVNYRGYGHSAGTPREADLKADSLAIYDAVTETYGLSSYTGMAWGRSLGSSVAAYLACERHLAGLILTCPKQLEIVKGAGHNTISGTAGYYDTVQAFLHGNA